MIWFEYTYNTPWFILERITLLSQASIIDFIIMGILALIFLSCIYYVVPYFYILQKYVAEEREKEKRKIFISRIAFQKDIEAEIEKELQL